MSLLLQNARPIGFPGVPETRRDVMIGDDGRIAAAGDSGRRLDLKGAYLSPGWVDLHTHVYWGATDISVRVAEAGAATGVTTVVDAGSAGEANFHGFRAYVAEPAREQVFAFLNVGSIGLVACNRVSELADYRSIDPDRILACVDANRDIVRGLKVRASGAILGGWGITPVRVAKRLAQIAGLPLMVHIGELPPVVDEVLDLLEPGDIVTHCFQGKPGGSLLDTPAVFNQAKRLAEQGVIMDLGHGAASFSYRVGQEAVARGLRPHTLSTDLHARNIGGPVWDLSLVMTKALALGLDLAHVVGAVTTAPRSAIREASPGLALGDPARFTGFDVVDSDLSLPDSTGVAMALPRRVLPRWTILGAEAIPAASRFA